MYGLVLLAALSASEGAAGHDTGYRPPKHPGPLGWPGYHNHGGWGLPYGGYGWPGYAGWGACGGYASAAYGVPMTPHVTPPPYSFERNSEDEKHKEKDKDKDKDKENDKGKKKDGEEMEKKDKPKKDSDSDSDTSTSTRARLTFLLPAGAKLYIDGKAVKAAPGQTFHTPALEKGESYYYEVKAEVMRDGKPVSETRRLTLKAGSSIRADFRKLGDTAVTSTK
jgi:uncharacterized protein (TIGR03000 family)